MLRYTSFETEDMPQFEPDAKIGLIATVNPEGLPHLTPITALHAKTPTPMYRGQFTGGMSKKNGRNDLLRNRKQIQSWNGFSFEYV